MQGRVPDIQILCYKGGSFELLMEGLLGKITMACFKTEPKNQMSISWQFEEGIAYSRHAMQTIIGKYLKKSLHDMIGQHWQKIEEQRSCRCKSVVNTRTYQCQMMFQHPWRNYSNYTLQHKDYTVWQSICSSIWDKWNSDDNATKSYHDWGKYTSNGTNRKYGGLLMAFNQLKQEVAPTIEGAIVDKLRKKYYPNASLDDIRQSKTRRKKCRRDLDGGEDELPQLPCTAWDPYSIVIQDGSSSSNKEQE